MSGSGITLWQRPRPKGNSGSTPLLPCDPERIDFGRPVFFCFGGLHLTTPKPVNGFAKVVEILAGGAAAHDAGAQFIVSMYEARGAADRLMARLTHPSGAGAVDPLRVKNRHYQKMLKTLYGWREGTVKTIARGMEKFDYVTHSAEDRERENEPYAKAYADHLMAHVFARQDVIPDLNGLEGRNRAEALARAHQALGNINLAGHCFGSYLLPFIHERMRLLMQERGFTEQEGRQARRHVHAVTFGDAGLWFHNAKAIPEMNGAPREPWDFTSVHFASTGDKMVQNLARVTPDLMPERNRIMRFGKEDNVVLFFSRLPREALALQPSRKTSANSRGMSRFRTVKSSWTGHDPYDYAGMTAPEDAYYTSMEGGQWFMPSALQTAMRGCLYTSLHGGRGDAAALLLPMGPAPEAKRARFPREVYMPAHPEYEYAPRMEELLQKSMHYDRLPARERHAWVRFLQAQNAAGMEIMGKEGLGASQPSLR